MISVTWGTKVINVPKADTQFVKFEPITGLEVRQLDLDQFRLDLKALEAGEEGMPFLDTHNHIAPVTVGGVTLARIVEIINGYTVQFEDGQYAVNLNGANTNLQDVTVVNQVSIRPNNAAGLTYSEEINSQSFTNNRVYINDEVGLSGTTFPRGTPTDPVDNLADAQTIASGRKFNSFDLTTHTGPIVLGLADDIEFTHWYGVTAGTSRLVFGGADAANASFDRMLLIGNIGDGPVYVTNGSMSNVSGFSGSAKEVALNGTITLDSGAPEQIVFFDCYSAMAGATRPTLDLNGITVDVMVRGYTGGLTITNMTENINVSFDGKAATLELDASCTNGIINVGGMTNLIDNSVGATVVTDRSIVDLTEAIKLVEIHRLRGLDSGNPVTSTPTKITATDIEIDITGDGENDLTLTRV
jgi:hypothetical protein